MMGGQINDPIASAQMRSRQRGVLMKFEITANQSTTSAFMNAVADTVNEFKPGAISECARCEAEHKIHTSSHVHYGPAYN